MTASAQVSGEVFPVAEEVSLPSTNGYLPATVSENGVLLYAARAGGGINQIGWYDRTGKSLGPVGAPGVVHCPSLSPDEKSVVFRVYGRAGGDLWVRDLSRGTETRFTSDAFVNVAPFWSPKGDRIVFASNRNGVVVNLYQKAASGTGQEEAARCQIASSISRLNGRGTAGSSSTPRLIRRPSLISGCSRWRATRRTESPSHFWDGVSTSYLASFAGQPLDGLHLGSVRPARSVCAAVSAAVRAVDNFDRGRQAPRWRGDGKEMFFEAADGKMMAVPVKARAGATPAFEAGAPMPLFDAHMAHATSFTDLFEYDVTADGKRFLINTTSRPGVVSGQALTMVVNWLAGAKK